MSNLVWVVASVVLLLTTWHGVCRGAVRLSMVSAMTLALALCFILLPVISMNDDVLEANQAALPLSGQTWRMASGPALAGLNLLLVLAAYLLLLVAFQMEFRRCLQDVWTVRPLAQRLARAQRLRPPPTAAQ